MNSSPRYLLFTCLLILFGNVTSWAQLPNCRNNLIYLQSNAIYNWNPTLPFSSANPVLNTIALPSGAGGLAVSPNLNVTTAPSPTFYTIVGGNYYYYNGTTWVNTGHSCGNSAAVNLGAGGGYIYALIGSTGQVYRYNGTGPGTLVATLTSFSGGGPYDLTVDCSGNFYILRVQAAGYLRKYSPNGTLLQSWTISGVPSVSAGGGFGIVNGKIFFYNSALYGGSLSGGNIAFINIPSPPASITGAADWANCPIDCPLSVFASIDTGYYCGVGPGIKVKALGNTGPYIWTTISGNATITGPASGDSITITATQTSRIVLSTANPSQGRDTVLIVVPTATLDAGPLDSINGCSTDTLHAQLKNTLTWIPYSYTWAPYEAISSGINTPNPIINPRAPTMYYVSVSVPANKGGCLWKDSVMVIPVDCKDDPSIIAEDTVLCAGQITRFTAQNKVWGVTGIIWNFGDNSDTFHSPVLTHVFKNPGTYIVKLTSSYSLYPDSTVTRTILVHPLPNVSILNTDTVIKYGQSVQLEATGASSYIWSPGSSLSDANSNSPIATPKEPTRYIVIGIDNYGCRNTDSVSVSVNYRDPLFLPNAFSPNGDNSNDVFHIPNLGFRKLLEFRIFNRWGQELFYSNDGSKGWDGFYNGTAQETGIYNYIIRVSYPDGYVETYRGDVTLIR